MAFDAKMPAVEDWFKSDGQGLSSAAIHYLGNFEKLPRTIANAGGLLDLAFGNTRGALIYRGEDGWTKIDPGTSGDVFTSNGAGADPSYQDKSSAWKLISSLTASSSSNLSFTTGIDSTYSNYEFVLENVLPATDNTELSLQLSTSGGTSYLSSGYFTSFATSDRIPLSQTSGTGRPSNSGGGVGGYIKLQNPSGAAYKNVIGVTSALNSLLTGTQGQIVSGLNSTASAVNAVKFFFQTGNIASGTIRMYGIKGS